MTQTVTDTCEMCGRVTVTTFHHLIPKAVHKKRRYVKAYGREEMRRRGLDICRLCHSGIHDLIPDEKVLARDFNTKDRLLAHEGVARHVAWAAKQKSRHTVVS